MKCGDCRHGTKSTQGFISPGKRFVEGDGFSTWSFFNSFSILVKLKQQNQQSLGISDGFLACVHRLILSSTYFYFSSNQNTLNQDPHSLAQSPLVIPPSFDGAVRAPCLCPCLCKEVFKLANGRFFFFKCQEFIIRNSTRH